MRTAPERLTVVLLAVMAVQASSGLIFAGQYRDPEWVRATWFGNDWITLVLAMPLLASSLVAARRGSARGLMVCLGTQAYAVYNYAFYLFGAALNVFFLFYVAACVSAAAALLVTALRPDVPGIAERFSAAAPRRMAGGGLLAIAIGLAAVWIAMWGAHVFAGRPTPVPAEAFKVVAALDLTLLVPAQLAGAILLLRGHRFGSLLCTVAGVQGTLYLIVLSVNSWVAVSRGLTAAPGELPIWGALAVVTGGLTAALLHAARCEESRGVREDFRGASRLA
jgi:hypothetical protein